MKTNPLKAKLAAREPVAGTWLTLADPAVGVHLTRAGWDFLAIDLEHSLTSGRESATVVAAVAAAGGVPLVRVPANRPEHVKQALDSGAFGVIVPLIGTRDEALAAARACRYPPRGERTLGGSLQVLAWGAASLAEYRARADDEVVVILQCERPAAVADFGAVFGVGGVDAVLAGPADLGLALGDPAGVEPLLAEIRAGCARLGLPAGVHAFAPADYERRRGEGWDLVTVASDAELLSYWTPGRVTTAAAGGRT